MYQSKYLDAYDPSIATHPKATLAGFLAEAILEGLPITLLLYLAIYYFIQQRLTKLGKVVVFMVLWPVVSVALKIYWDIRH